jgi:hypothetical protein
MLDGVKRGGRGWLLTSTLGLGFLSILVGGLLVYEHVVFEDGPELLAGRPLGAPCDDSEQCRGPLGSATRREVPKACAVTGTRGECALECVHDVDCPTASECLDAVHRESGTALPARLCVHRASDADDLAQARDVDPSVTLR